MLYVYRFHVISIPLKIFIYLYYIISLQRLSVHFGTEEILMSVVAVVKFIEQGTKTEIGNTYKIFHWKEN